MPVKSAHIYYAGMVQGVGFRLAAHTRATSLGLKGWVKNLDDGRVEVLCEGDEPGIKAFLENMSSVFNGYIRDIDIDWQDRAGRYEAFDVRFD